MKHKEIWAMNEPQHARQVSAKRKKNAGLGGPTQRS